MKFPSKPSKVLAALLSTSLMAGVSVESAAANKIKAAQKFELADDTIIVKFKPNTKKANRQQMALSFGASFKDKNGDGVDDRFRHVGKGRLAQLQLPKGADPMAIIDRLKRDPSVEYAEPNYKLYPSVIPNDPDYNQLWGMPKIKAEQGWEMEMGSKDVVIGVIDTGVDYTHPDLIDNMWINPNEVAGNGVDDDGNGYIDDVHGISAINDNGNPQDTHYHGTHVAGTIGATGNNDTGVVGVNWNTSIVGCSFLTGQGGSTTDAIQCIDYMVDLKNRGVNIRVLNNSWGGGSFSQALKDAIIAADNADMLFVAAAGNDAVDNDTVDNYPSNYDVPNVMAIASTTSNDDMSDFSQWGATTVDMGAPGSSIVSTVPGGYDSLSGTSMATPHVAGAAGLVLSANGGLTTAEVKDILMTSGDPLAALDGLTVSGKRLNVENALNMAGAGGPGFYLLSSPNSRTVNQGAPTSYDIDVNAVGGYEGSAAMSANAPGLNADISFSDTSVEAGSSTIMTVQTNSNTLPGEYTISVTAVDGDINKSVDVQLKVYPEGTFTGNFANNTPVDIPDADSAGVDSIINVPMGLTITELSVNLDISHTYISDLIVTLTSPEGTAKVLHNREGGSSDNIVATYEVSDFDLENAMGDWILNVSDNVGADTGTINNWSLDITGGSSDGANLPPTVTVASPTANALYLPGEVVQFEGDAVDPEDGDVRETLVWTSNLDGEIGTGASFSRSDLSEGTHQITVTATDDEGLVTNHEFFLYIVTDGTTVSYEDTQRYPIHDLDTLVATMEVPLGVTIGEMNIFVDIQHSFNNDMLIHLVSPTGTRVELFDQREPDDHYRDLIKTFYPEEFNGENAAGTWELHIQDEYQNNSGNLRRWVLTFTHQGGGSNNEIPVVNISSPVVGAEYTEGDEITFSATADDVEDGNVASSLVWSSDRDGVIGNGASFTTSTLSIGSHVITATASDSDEATGDANVSLQVVANEAPTADFSFLVNDLEVEFSDLSSDTDGAVVAWDWDLGDGNSSTAANFSHSYAAQGDYLVTLTVTDDKGATSSLSQTVTVIEPIMPIDLSASAKIKRNGLVVSKLAWSGATSKRVDIYRDGVLIRTVRNKGKFKDRFSSEATNFEYQVCEAGTDICSATIEVVAEARAAKR